MNLKKKRMLITGGAGFIGGNLRLRLAKLGAKVDIYDQVDGNDITDTNNLASFIRRKYDAVYHLAGFSGSRESNLEREKSFNINTLATAALCELIVKFSPKTKLIVSSSRLEYGKPQYLPVDEKHPTMPTSAYGLSKLCATQIALVFAKNNGLDVTVFRTSNAYGSHILNKFSGYNVINHFVDLVKTNKSLTIFGRGSQKRDYLYVDDLVDAFILASQKKSYGQIYNLGFGQGIKLVEMAKLIISTVGGGRIKFVKWPKDYQLIETGDYISNISKAKKDLGFSPKVDFKEGIRKTINYKL